MWLGFGEALAAVAGALTGPLFVALSVKSDVRAALQVRPGFTYPALTVWFREGPSHRAQRARSRLRRPPL